ncbi:MAG: hypothetical protein AAB262_02790 [Elusimicrobiota bacterium]
MIEKGSKALRMLLGAALVSQTVGCGTIMYPERRGQKAGQIDVAVAALDAIGLLFFIIPGVIAFAVDFNNGTIYLPKAGKGLLNLNELEKVRFAPGADAKASVEAILREKIGLTILLGQDDLVVFELKSVDEIAARLAAVQGRLGARRTAALSTARTEGSFSSAKASAKAF